MVYVSREWITSVPTEEQERLFLSSLAGRYSPVIGSARARLSSLLGLEDEGKDLPLAGELFVPADGKNSGKVFYYLKFSTGIEVGSIAPKEIADEHNAFVQTILSGLGDDAKRRRLQPVNRVFAAMSQEWGNFPVSDEDRAAARVLLEPAAQSFLRGVAQTGRIPVGDEEKGAAKAVVTRLEKAGMVKSQYSIFCRQTGNQIMMVDSTEAIEEATKQGFKCFVCGRSFSEEKQTQFVSPTTYGHKMSKSNYWLVIQTVEALHEAFQPDKISVEHEGEVATIFLNVDASLLLVELKEASYHLKDAYLLAKKIEVYKPAASYLLTLTPPGPDVARYLTSTLAGASFWSGGSLDDLKARIPELISRGQKNHVLEILERFTPSSTIVLERRLLPFVFEKDGHLLRHVEVEEPALPPEPEMPTVAAVPEQIAPTQPAAQAKEEPVEALPREIVDFDAGATRQQAPDKNALVKKILDELANGVAGRESSLHILLQDLTDADRKLKACLISQDGLLVASTLQGDAGEALASYGSECFSLVQNLLKDQDLYPLNTLTMSSKNFLVELYPVPGFYLVTAAELEPASSEPLPEGEISESLPVVCERLLSKQGIKSTGLMTPEGLMMSEAGADSGESGLFPVFLELFPKLSSYFGPMDRGDLLSIAVRTPSYNIGLTQAGRGYIGIAFESDRRLEDLVPHVLAIGEEASRLFSPAEV